MGPDAVHGRQTEHRPLQTVLLVVVFDHVVGSNSADDVHRMVASELEITWLVFGDSIALAPSAGYVRITARRYDLLDAIFTTVFKNMTVPITLTSK